MEEAIEYFRPVNTLAKKEDLDFNHGYNLWAASVRDDVDEFLRLIKLPRFQPKRDYYHIRDLFKFDALNCSIAVFEGKTQPYVDIPYGVALLIIAASQPGPRVVKYLLDRGDSLDVFCRLDNQLCDPIDVALEASMRYADPHWSLFGMLTKIFYHHRPRMEIVRMLVEQTQNKERVKQAFIDYLKKGKLGQFAVLFLAVPELLVTSSLTPLYCQLKISEKKTHNEYLMLLLLEVLAKVGDKLVAYVRLAETSMQSFYQTQLDTDFFLREVCGKHGDTLPDHYFRFHVRSDAVQQSSQEEEDDDDDDWLTWDEAEYEEHDMFNNLPHFVSRKDFDRAHVFRQLPSLKPEDADGVKRAIEKKLSSMHLNLETITLISNEEEKLLPMPFFRTTAASFPLVKPDNFQPLLSYPTFH